MDEKTLKRANEIQEAIENKRNAVEDITGIMQNRELAFHKMQIVSVIENSHKLPVHLDLGQVQPELDHALQQAQIRLRREITELDNEFKQL